MFYPLLPIEMTAVGWSKHRYYPVPIFHPRLSGHEFFPDLGPLPEP